MRRKLLLTVSLVLPLCTLLFTTSSFKSTNVEHWFCDDLKYTYQIEVHNTRKSVSVTSDLCMIISKNRSKSEIVTVQLDSNVFLKVFSEDQIKDLDEIERSIKEIIYL